MGDGKKMVERGINPQAARSKPEALLSPLEPARMKLADERLSATHKFTLIDGEKALELDGDGMVREVSRDVEGYITAGVYPNGKLGEVFLTIGREGAHWKAFECLMIAVSVGLQYGIPLAVFRSKFENMRFEPSGMTKNPAIPISKSMVDYIFRWLEAKFPGGYSEALDVSSRSEEDADNESCGCDEKDAG